MPRLFGWQLSGSRSYLPAQVPALIEAQFLVDGLGGESVAQLVRMDGTDKGSLGHGGDVAVHGETVEGTAVV